MKLASVAISILALGHGLLKVASTVGASALSKPVYWMITFLWFSSDQALRSAGYALVLAPGARPYGIALMALAALASCGLTIRSRSSEPVVWLRWQTLAQGAVCFFIVYLVPFYLLDPESAQAVPVFLVRWVEAATCAFLSYAFATTGCGHVPTNEVLGLWGLLAFNVLCCLIRHFCFDPKTGNFLCFDRDTLQEEGGEKGSKNLATGTSATSEAAAGSRQFTQPPKVWSGMVVVSCSS